MEASRSTKAVTDGEGDYLETTEQHKRQRFDIFIGLTQKLFPTSILSIIYLSSPPLLRTSYQQDPLYSQSPPVQFSTLNFCPYPITTSTHTLPNIFNKRLHTLLKIYQYTADPPNPQILHPQIQSTMEEKKCTCTKNVQSISLIDSYIVQYNICLALHIRKAHCIYIQLVTINTIETSTLRGCVLCNYYAVFVLRSGDELGTGTNLQKTAGVGYVPSTLKAQQNFSQWPWSKMCSPIPSLSKFIS